MAREFQLTKKKEYSYEDVVAILEQHTNFIEGNYKDFISPEEHNKVRNELTPLKKGARDTHIKNVIKDLVAPDTIGDAITLAGIDDDDDDKTIKTKIAEIVKTRAYLKPDNGLPAEITETSNDKQEIVETPEAKAEGETSQKPKIPNLS